jgi:hypothetical protein
MRKDFIVALTGAVALLTNAAAAAPHGKAGLWTIVTAMKMANMPQLPPEVMAMMKQRGIPGMGQPVTSQICMTAEQAQMTTPPRSDPAGMQCTPRLVSQTGNSAVTEVVCHGRMEGTGRTEITWRGDSHYEGNYSFKGAMEGQPQEMSSHYSGDWVKADCGAVKPFDANAAANRAPRR